MGADPTGGRNEVSTQFLGRLATRARVRRWNRTKVVAVVVGSVLVLLALGWVVLGSSLLTVRTVEVRGTSGALASRVEAVAAESMGTPLARVDLGAVEQAVAAIRGVGEVSVVRSWPRTLRVEVDVRTPVAVTRSGEGVLVLDGTGAVLATREERPDGLPLVVVRDGVGARLGDGLVVLRALPPKVRGRADRVEVRSAEDIRVELSNGDVVRWGSVHDSERKAEVLAALLPRRADVYDVSAPSLPTTRG